MKRCIWTLMVLAVGLLCGRLSHELPVSAQECDNEPPRCQDVNGDGVADIADAIYLLSWLFGGGQEPECSCSACPPCRLPATGQTLCYDTAGNVIACDNPALPGQDGSYQAGYPREGRFADNGNGTVTDNCTGLTWQQATADINGDGWIHLDNDRLGWAEALRYCENLVLCGDGTWLSSTQIGWAPDPEETDEHGGILWDDWRLPNVIELQIIVDYARFQPAIDPVFSAESEPWDKCSYWSSSSFLKIPAGAWVANFHGGGIGGEHKLDPYYVRAVRGGL